MDLRTTWLWRSTTKQKYSQEFIHPLILSPTPTYWNWKKKLKKRQKKLSLFSILFFLELLSENQRLLTMTNLPSKPQTVSKPKHFIRFYSVGVFYLLLLSCQPFFAQELCRLPNWISVVGWNRQARLNGSPGVQHPHNVNQASEKTSRKLT